MHYEEEGKAGYLRGAVTEMIREWLPSGKIAGFNPFKKKVSRCVRLDSSIRNETDRKFAFFSRLGKDRRQQLKKAALRLNFGACAVLARLFLALRRD